MKECCWIIAYYWGKSRQKYSRIFLMISEKIFSSKNSTNALASSVVVRFFYLVKQKNVLLNKKTLQKSIRRIEIDLIDLIGQYLISIYTTLLFTVGINFNNFYTTMTNLLCHNLRSCFPPQTSNL